MSVRIVGAQYPLKEIFSDDFIFEIPSYQRPYSWTTEHAGELLDDLLMASDTATGGSTAPYFLGSIVLAKQENAPLSRVIDGQQRLTTLTILLAALAAHAGQEEARELREFILQKGSALKQTKTIYRLRLRPRDELFFRTHVQESDGIIKLLDLDPGKLTDPEKNLQANARLFLTRLADLTPAERSALATYMLNDCFLVAVSTPDTESAFRIFTVLNDRGLNLSHADIIKSELIGRISPEEQDEYTDIWESAEEELGIEDFASLFSHIRMIYAKTKQRESLMKEFRTQVEPKVADPRVFIRQVVAPYADIYARMRSGSWESSTNAESINRTLGWLSRIDNVDWIPPALSFLELHKNEPAEVDRFLGALERLAASMFVRRVNINGRIDRYAWLLREIEAGSSTEGATSLELTQEERDETVRQLKGELYLERRTRSYVLLRLDEAVSTGGATYEHRLITVEHVLPQNPAQGSLWTKWFSEEEREHWVHRIANLVLLPRQRNSAAQNFEFDRKKSKYFSSQDGTSPFALTTQVLSEELWTPQLLERRQRKLIDRLVDLWRLRPR